MIVTRDRAIPVLANVTVAAVRRGELDAERTDRLRSALRIALDLD